MKFIQILEEPIEPGGLVEWTPFTPGGLGTWSSDARPTSHNHEQHLRAAFAYRVRTRREGGRESWLGLKIEFDEPLSVPAVRATLHRWIDRHEVLRSHVVIDNAGLTRLSTAAGSVKLKMGRIGWYNESGPLVEQLAGAFDRATAPLHWPAYMFATVGRESSFTLLFAADHSLVDGYSLIMAQHELALIYRAESGKRSARAGDGSPASLPLQLPDVGSYVDFSAAERYSADQADSTHPAVAAWATFLASGAGDMPSLVAPTPDAPTDPIPTAADTGDPVASDVLSGDPVAQRSLSGVLADDTAANHFTAVCSHAGGSLTAGLLAAFATAHHHLTGDPEFRCVLPRHTRNDARWLTSLGWFVAVAPFCLDMADSPTFDQAVTRSTDELKRSRQGAGLPFLRVGQLLGHHGEPRFVISFIDTRFASGADAADAGRATVLRSHSYSPDEVLIWINRTPSGLRFSTRFPSRLDDPARVADASQGPAPQLYGADDQAGAGLSGTGPVVELLRAVAHLVHTIGEASTFNPQV